MHIYLFYAFSRKNDRFEYSEYFFHIIASEIVITTLGTAEYNNSTFQYII